MSEIVESVVLESLMSLCLFMSCGVNVRVGGLNKLFSQQHMVSLLADSVLCIIQEINQCSCFNDVFLILR